MDPIYAVVLFFHILGGIVWVGANIFYNANVLSAWRSEGQVAADQAMRHGEWSEKLLFIPAPLLVLATGIAMILMNSAIRFTDLWIVIAITLYLVSMGVAGGWGSKMYKEVLVHREAGTVGSPEFGQLLTRLLRASSIDTLALVGILSMMVFRPL